MLEQRSKNKNSQNIRNKRKQPSEDMLEIIYMQQKKTTIGGYVRAEKKK